jgi:hypothetical protein
MNIWTHNFKISLDILSFVPTAWTNNVPVSFSLLQINIDKWMWGVFRENASHLSRWF